LPQHNASGHSTLRDFPPQGRDASARLQTSFIVLSEIGLGQARGLNDNRFASRRSSLPASDAGKQAKA
jgi:hypothetical protein